MPPWAASPPARDAVPWRLLVPAQGFYLCFYTRFTVPLYTYYFCQVRLGPYTMDFSSLACVKGDAMWRVAALAIALCAAAALAGCGGGGDGAGGSGIEPPPSKQQTFSPSGGDKGERLVIASGSENREAAGAIQMAADESGVTVEMHYMGSVDIMNLLRDGADGYDAVWPASSMWISMGDERHIVRDAESTSTTPVVLGVRKSKAEELGWVSEDGTATVGTSDIVAAVRDGKLRFAMTSATQSNSGASAYLSFLTNLAGKDDPLTAEDVGDKRLQEDMKALLSGVDRSSGSSDWLKDMYLADPSGHDAMVNYESIVIQTDKELAARGEEPLVAVYPKEGIAISDSPLGYIDRDQGADAAFGRFQDALTGDGAKLELERVGRRTGLAGKIAFPDDADVKAAFNPDWGIVADGSVLRSSPLPSADVISEALNVYQSALRKPSYTIWVVDYSGSMYGEGKDGVTAGLEMALGDESKGYMIQPTKDDVNILIPFDSDARDSTRADGTDTGALLEASRENDADGGTDMYAGLTKALGMLPDDMSRYSVAIVLMTDGESMDFGAQGFEDAYARSGGNVPVFSIMFGDADDAQLKPIAEMTNGKVFDGRSGDLADTFRTVRGYN